MKDRYSQSGVPSNEIVEDPNEYMSVLIKKLLPMDKWGFKESAQLVTDSPKIIYNSQWCRIKFLWDNWEMYTGNSISIYYGRLHAPNDEARLIWNEEECRCWHGKMGSSHVLDFLDKLTPQDAINKKGFPKLIQEMHQADWFKNMANKRRGPELALTIEAKIWDYYGVQLFELFDLRQPELWERYRKWLKEYYVLSGESEERNKQFGILIPSYQVC
jgi:hypothetical protein